MDPFNWILYNRGFTSVHHESTQLVELFIALKWGVILLL